MSFRLYDTKSREDPEAAQISWSNYTSEVESEKKNNKPQWYYKLNVPNKEKFETKVEGTPQEVPMVCVIKEKVCQIDRETQHKKSLGMFSVGMLFYQHF